MAFRDLVYAGRTLRKNPIFTGTSVITLALGIGATTAVFSVTEAVLLHPLPYRDPGRLVFVMEDLTKRSVKDFPFSAADFFDLRNGTKSSFEDFAAVDTQRQVITRDDGTPEQVGMAEVTPNFFRMIGAKIALGRDFTEADGEAQPSHAEPGAAPDTSPAPRLPTIAVLSYEYFQRRYGGDRSIIGHLLRTSVEGDPVIVGVLAPGFELLFPPGTNVEARPDIWTAARLTYDNAQRLQYFLRPVARLKKGVSPQQAQAAADAVAAHIRKISPIEGPAGFRARIEPMRDYIVAAARSAILALMGASLFLLLIASANVANLMLARMSLRERELAVRTSFGGSWWQLVRQIFTEALLIASAGTMLGIGLGWLGIHALLRIAPPSLPRMESIGMNSVALCFALMVGMAATALFGIVPAMRAARPDITSLLRASDRTAGLARGRWLRDIVVISQVALCFVLLIGSGLMFRSFVALKRVDPGYNPDHLLTFQLLGPHEPTPAGRAAFMRDLRDRLRAIPGIKNVTASTPFPLTGNFYALRWGLAAALLDASKFQAADHQSVLPGYFETMRTPRIAGRTFTEADNAPERKLVVIDETLAAKAFPHESAVGRRILIRFRTPEPHWVEVIGVVAHQRDISLAEAGREQMYSTDGFGGHGITSHWAVRTEGDPLRYAEAVRKVILRINPHLLIAKMQPMSALMDQARANTRFSLLLIGLFGVIAASLAVVGLYGVLSTVVRQRTAEIGVRMELGATPANIFKVVVGNGLRLSAAGIIIGLFASLGLTRMLTSMLVSVTATDPATFGLIAMLFFLLAGLASWLPASRAASLDPTVALREQ
ncbi:MAG: ABC transporter permease [Bryobacteraceae bacterium]